MLDKCLMVCSILLVQKVKQEKKNKNDCLTYENIFFPIYDSLPTGEFWHNCKEVGNWTTLGLLRFLADFKHLEKYTIENPLWCPQLSLGHLTALSMNVISTI